MSCCAAEAPAGNSSRTLWSRISTAYNGPAESEYRPDAITQGVPGTRYRSSGLVVPHTYFTVPLWSQVCAPGGLILRRVSDKANDQINRDMRHLRVSPSGRPWLRALVGPGFGSSSGL